MASPKKTYRGSCHCGAVKFEADLDLAAGTAKCNCSICFKTRAWMAFIPASDLRVLSGEGALRDYQFNRKNIHHHFCGTCGVRVFGRATGPDGKPAAAIRVNVLDGVEPAELLSGPVTYMDMLHDDFRHAPEETRHL
jgi:hypothetical protein